jgi:DHA3 family macrolide efflux protein-like MFS transporter
MIVTNRQSWKRTTALFLTSQTLSILGSSLVQYALLWYVTLQTKSGVMMTLFIIAGFLPTFLISPLAGVWADRHDRKRLIILADGLIALVTFALALVFMTGDRSLWLFFLAAAIRSVGTAIQGPAVGAILPQFVPEDKLMRVNSINGTIQSAIMLGSPVIAGTLMTVAPLPVIFFLDVATAAMAIGILVFFFELPPHPRSKEKKTTSPFKDIVLGFSYIREHAHLVPFFFYVGSILVLVTPAAFLTPLQTARSFGPEVWRLTAIEMVFSIGMMAGGGLLAVWGGFRNRMRTMVLSTVIMGACTVALGVVPNFWVYLVFMGIFGIAMPLHMTPSTVMLQERVDPAFLGRVFSVLTMLSTSLMPLGMLAYGPLAEVVAIETLLLVTGATVVLLGLLVPLSRRLMAFGEPLRPSPPDLPPIIVPPDPTS